MIKKPFFIGLCVLAILIPLGFVFISKKIEMKATSPQPDPVRSRQALAGHIKNNKKEISEEIKKRSQRKDSGKDQESVFNLFTDITSKMEESDAGYSWSEKIRAVPEKEVHSTDTKLGTLAGRTVVLRSTEPSAGDLVVSVNSKSQIGIYSGTLVLFSKDPGIENFLRDKKLTFTMSNSSYFIKQTDFRKALSTLADIRSSFPDAPADLDIITQRLRAM